MIPSVKLTAAGAALLAVYAVIFIRARRKKT